MKLTDLLSGNANVAEWEAKGYQLPKFDIAAVRQRTHDEPTWVHFGGGNIFRACPAASINDALNTGQYDRGVIVAETFDYEVIDKAYKPYDNLSLLVSLQSSGTIEKKVIASVTESLKADYQFSDWARLVEIFCKPSLQMITFTITEKGYSFNDADLARGLTPVLAMGKVTALLLERFKAGQLPLTVQSMDNCSHNGDKVKAGVMAYAERWVADGLAPAEFLAYLKDEKKITFPWSMIDKITPRPHVKVKEMLAADPFRTDEAEGIVDVAQSLPGMLACLALLEADALHHIIIYRDTCYLADALCHLIALVVAPVPLPAPRDGHGHECVDAVEEAGGVKMPGSNDAHVTCQFGHVVILHVIDEAADGCLRLVEEQCSGALNGKLSPEEARQGIVERLLLIMRQRQVQMADTA